MVHKVDIIWVEKHKYFQSSNQIGNFNGGYDIFYVGIEIEKFRLQMVQLDMS